nr:hypothetical protein [Tanacetum cinerariifolium]
MGANEAIKELKSIGIKTATLIGDYEATANQARIQKFKKLQANLAQKIILSSIGFWWILKREQMNEQQHWQQHPCLLCRTLY